jgi:predicted O-methyltransferase YrrM
MGNVRFYELRITWRTIRKEGFGVLSNKIRIYFKDLFGALVFLFARSPEPKPEAVLNFTWDAGSGLIRPAQIKSELLELLNWIAERPQPRTVLEIGTCGGGTLYCWCALAAPDARIISLDLPGGIHGGGYPYWKTFLYRRFAGPKQKLNLLRGDSHDPAMLEAIKKLLPPDGLDLLFIDGDHTLKGVRQDYEMFSPLVKPGGKIIFHDVAPHRAEFNCQVDQVWNELKQGREHWEFIENLQQGHCGIGIIIAN